MDPTPRPEAGQPPRTGAASGAWEVDVPGLLARLRAVDWPSHGAGALSGAYVLPPPADLEPRPEPKPAGTLRVLGRYRDLSPLAEGGSAEVYKAFDGHLHRWVALKIIWAGSTQEQDRVLQEARLQAGVDHPHVCKIFDAGVVDGYAYIALQLVEHRTLAEVARELDLAGKVRAVRDVAEGVHAAHRAGLLHLDLKPGNVLMERQDAGWHPLVSDFGLAQRMGQAGVVPLGTPPYSSPEQVLGDGALVSARSDVYALGVSLYVLACGALPFDIAPGDSLLTLTREAPRVPLRVRLPGAPRELEAVLARAMALDPADRHPTARAFAEALRGTLDRLSPAPRRRRLPILLGAVAALAVGFGLVQLRRAAFHRDQGLYAQHFERDVQVLEGMLRQDMMLAPHDVRPARQRIAAGVEELRARLRTEGAAAQGPGHYALGRGLAMLGRDPEALEALRKAWALGYRPAEVQVALGEVLIRSFVGEDFRASQVPDEARRKAARARAKREFYDEGLRLVRAGAPHLVGMAQVSAEATAATAEGRWPELVDLGTRIQAEAPWSSDGWMHRARARSGLAEKLAADGKAAEAAPFFEQSVLDWEEALRKAPSRTFLHKNLARTLRLWARSRFQAGLEPRPLLDRAEALLEAGHGVDPDFGGYRENLAETLLLRAEVLAREGRPAAADLDRVAALADEQARSVPGHPAPGRWRKRIAELRGSGR